MDTTRASLIWALLGLMYGAHCALTTGGTWYLIASAVILIASGAVCRGSAIQIVRRPDQQRY
ncbi:hypothetical protein [Paenarthrobacter nitroguajacolicus]|uniref:hypothetical protein n=1 Tax=Paenarthrobacter nitroguajacolicus TaxID=211146 RepID=UPI0015BCDABF|nr:hypothetical protein [Paenarthrobacter nitroguajacolicus]NWL32081.1 hypothetical protein [Paenarthrobacter nitroguajacolicus]